MATDGRGMPTIASAPEHGSVPPGASTSKQHGDVIIQMDGRKSTSKQEDDVAHTGGEQVDGIEEETHSNTHQESVGIEEETHSNTDQECVEWVNLIRKKLDEYTRSPAAETEIISIPRVPKGPRGFGHVVKKAYEPLVISIGLYHWRRPHLNNMQKLKWQCLKDISVHLPLSALFKELKTVEIQARSFYPESKTNLKKGDFLEMLLLDGCFIVDYLCRASSDNSSDESKTKIWSDHQIRNDLLLLENQLPFFVVECIYRLVKHLNGNKELVNIVMELFHSISPKDLVVHELEKRNFKHLLHLYHAYLFFDEHNGWEEAAKVQGQRASKVQEQGASKVQGQGASKVQEQGASQERAEGASQVRSIPSEQGASQERAEGASQVRSIPSAILLQEVGIKFQKRQSMDKAINVRFNDGVMKITPLVIDAFTISLFLNLIQFEQAHPDMEPRFTAFLQFMDCLINTAQDVALLRKNEILVHAFGSDEEVAGIFNRLTSGIFHQLSWELMDVYEKTNEHFKSNWKRWRATVLRDHFGSPMAAIAILAAVILLFADCIQAFFSVYSYFRPRSAS